MTVDIAQAPVPTGMTMGDQIAYSRELAHSGLLPDAFRGKPANVLWAVQYGLALDLHPAVIMSSVHVMDGKPAPSAGLIGALVRRAGHRLRIGWEKPSEGAIYGTAWAEVYRHDDPDFAFRSEWTVERAVQAEICELRQGKVWHRTKQNKTGNWQKYPIQMPKARAIGEASRDGAMEALLGMSYTAEELDPDHIIDDIDAEMAEPTGVRTPPRRRARSAHITGAATSVATPEPDAKPVTEHAVTVDAPPELPEPPGLSAATRGDMMRLFRAAGIGDKGDDDRAARLRVAEILTEQTLTSSDQLSEDDGRVIVDALRMAGDSVANYVEGLLGDEDAERAQDAANKALDAMADAPDDAQ